jgi:hypothetical protein
MEAYGEVALVDVLQPQVSLTLKDPPPRLTKSKMLRSLSSGVPLITQRVLKPKGQVSDSVLLLTLLVKLKDAVPGVNESSL